MGLQTEFREDLKGLYRLAGGANKPTVFLFDETQIVMETFVEDVNNILTSGEVPNLFGKDEIGGVLDEVRADAKKVMYCCYWSITYTVGQRLVYTKTSFPIVDDGKYMWLCTCEISKGYHAMW